MPTTIAIAGAVGPRLLDWAHGHLRDLPWRRTRDPWAILVAETMLQQTQVSRVFDRWPLFMGEFPDPRACAARPVGDVVRSWEGLGYNRRAISLHGAATMIVERYHGHVPDALEELVDLPGVGPYTARAVRAFAFELPAAVVDTNVGRVLARLAGRTLALREAQEMADSLLPADASWRWNQGIMELGAVVCTRRAPHCSECPLVSSCRWRGTGPDPADGSAAVGRGQPRFEGSDRQLRGRLVDVLRVGPVRRDHLGEILDAEAGRVDRIVDGLVRDRLAVVAGDHVELP